MSRPIIIEKYNPNWPKIYQKEKKKIEKAIGKYIEKIEHIGSTSIENLASKPIIDILIGIRKLSDAKFCIPSLEELNYQYVPEYEVVLPERRYFRKPPRDECYSKFHVHMVETSSYFWKRQILFRDYLRENPQIAKEYEELKKQLAMKYQNNRVAYNIGKTNFINDILEKAQQKNI